MQSYSIRDLHRILVGTAPFAFLLEVLVRTCVVFAILTVVVRLLGKRMSGQVSNLELAVMLVLGAIVSAPMQIPEQGVTPSLLLLAWLLVLQRTLSALTARSARVERTIQGPTTMLVKDGRLELDALATAHVSREQLFAMLRTQRYRHLGEVARVYLEGCGAFSVLRADDPKPGLTLAPTFDENNGEPASSRRTDLVACGSCADVKPACDHPRRCAICGRSQWRTALGEPRNEESPSDEQAHAAQ